MDESDLIEARRSAERWVIRCAYDYALATLGRLHLPGRAQSTRVAPDRVSATQQRMLDELKDAAERLIVAGLIDAHLCPISALDDILKLGLEAKCAAEEIPGE